jgi:hypothetical protein
VSDNQRRHPRFDVDTPAVVQGSDQAQAGNIRNLSASGAAIEFDLTLGKPSAAFDLGDAVEMQPKGSKSVTGVVVRSYDGGIAMQFDENEEDLLQRIAAIAREMRDRR